MMVSSSKMKFQVWMNTNTILTSYGIVGYKFDKFYGTGATPEKSSLNIVKVSPKLFDGSILFNLDHN